jgi:hypothetical protein
MRRDILDLPAAQAPEFSFPTVLPQTWCLRQLATCVHEAILLQCLQSIDLTFDLSTAPGLRQRIMGFQN